MTRTWLLAVHIAGAAGWLGANFVQLVLSPRFARGAPDVAAVWSRQTVWLGERYYPVVGAVIGISGVLLVLDGDWSWSAGFIWVGISVIVIGAILGASQFGPLAKRRADALDAGETERAAALQTRIVRLGILDTALIVTAVLAMVDKWRA